MSNDKHSRNQKPDARGPDATPPSRPEEQFKSFVSQSVGFVVALAASVPLLTDYFGLIAIPKVGSEQSKLLPLLATTASGLIFLALFWTRDRFVSARWIIGGVIFFLLGIALLTFTHRFAGIASDMATVTYLIGFPATLAGAALVFLYGFVRYQERAVYLQQLYSRLEPDQWSALEHFAHVQVAIRDTFERLPNTSAKEAMERSAENLIAEYNQMLRKLQDGIVEIRGPKMDDIFGYFMQGVKVNFRALSRDDLDYWASQDSEQYLRANQRLLARGCQIERIFLLPRDKQLIEKHQDAIRKQLHLQIKVRITYLENVRRIVDDDRELDFGLFDSFAVSFWRFTSGRVFRVITAADQCKLYEDRYKRVADTCIAVPGKDGPDSNLFESEDEFNSWLAKTREGHPSI